MVLASFVGYQFGMSALLDHSALMEHSDLVAEITYSADTPYVSHADSNFAKLQ